MAISKKSLGKVLAISMASAMAMSSLSAALVSVSAVSPAALASNGNVQLNQDKVISNVSTEDAIRNAIGVQADENRVDALTGKEFDLNAIADILKTDKAIKYTDSDGQVGYVKPDSDGISFRANGAASIKDSGTTGNALGGKKDVLKADRAGSSTLTITVKGKVELGGGKNDKSVTLKHTIDVDVHNANDYGLVAYKDGTLLTDDDLNNLAAYGESIDFTLVKYSDTDSADVNAFNPSLDTVVAKDADDALEDGSVSKADVWKAFEPKLKALGLDKRYTTEPDENGENGVTVLDSIKAKIMADGALPTVPANTGLSTDTFGLDLKYSPTEVRGYEIPVKAFANANAKRAYDANGNLWTEEANSTDIVTELKDATAAKTALASPDDKKVYTLKVTGAGDKKYTVYGKTLDTTADSLVSGNYWKKDDTQANMMYLVTKSGHTDEDTVIDYTKFTALSSATDATKLDENTDVIKLVPCVIDDSKKQTSGLSPVSLYEDTDKETDAKSYANLVKRAKDSLSQANGNAKINYNETAEKYFFDVADKVKIAKTTLDDPELAQALGAVVITDESQDKQGQTILSADERPDDKTTIAINDAYKAAYDSVSGGAVAEKGGTFRFYAGTGDDLFDEQEGVDGTWEKGNKGKDNKKGITIASGNRVIVTLDTNGTTGGGSVKISVPAKEGDGTDEFTLNVKVVRAADYGTSNVVIKKSGSKTYEAGNDNRNISGYEIRTSGTVTVENGTVGNIVDATGVRVEGGRTGVIDVADTAPVVVTEDGITGDILNAQSVEVSKGGRVGKIIIDNGTVGNVTLNEGTIAEIDTSGNVDIEGGTVNGNIKSSREITITSNDDDSNDNPLDVVINGNVTASGANAKIDIQNASDDGEASIEIDGNVLARFAGGTDNTVTIGDADTSGAIRIKGVVEGERVNLGGNGLLTLSAVRAANEVEKEDKDGEIIKSSLTFAGFNSAIGSISNFEDVTIDEGTVTVKGAVDVVNLTVSSDAQLVADSITIEEDISDSGSIVVPVGKLTVNGSVDDSPYLALLGDVKAGDLAFMGNRGLVNAFETGGITLKAQRQNDGDYHYLVDKVELGGLTAVGKDVALGVGQTKTVSLALDGALPEGASIQWSVDDSDVATVEGNGLTATITGKEIDDTSVSAKIVDANGRDLGYNDANFEVNVLGVETVDSIGGDIGTGENELDLDTKKKNMEAGQVYTFMVRGNNDVENISVTSGDTNVATVALANGADSRGALYNITAVADGKTDITVTYQGKTSKIAVKVGGFQLDTSSKKMAPGQVYSVLAKNVPADQAGNVTLAYDSNIVDVVKVNDNYNGRGVLFNVTAKAIGETEVKVTHNGETETMAVNVVENTGRLTLDTASYTMPFGGSYTIGVKVEKNGRQLSGEEVRAMISSGELVVTDSRTGSIVTTEVQANGNVRVTGRQNEGTTYVQFIVMQNGQRVTHASVGVTVQNGATAGGSSVRSISQW